MSLSETDLLANFIASSKCLLVISGTRSSSSSTSMAPASRKLHSLFKVSLGDLRDKIFFIVHIHGSSFSLSDPILLPANIHLNALPDGELTSSLANLSQIRTRESFSHLRQKVDINFLAERRLFEIGVEDSDARRLIGKRDVDELVETPWTKNGGFDDVRPVGGSDDEHVLLASHPVHLSEDLIDDSVPGATSVSAGPSTRLGNAVQLIEEENAGSCGSCFVEDFPYVGLGLSEPHGEKFGALDGDEVGLAFVSDGLGQQSLTAARGSVEQHSLAWHHSELEELLWMLHGVLDQLLKF